MDFISSFSCWKRAGGWAKRFGGCWDCQRAMEKEQLRNKRSRRGVSDNWTWVERGHPRSGAQVHGVIRNATIPSARVWFSVDTGWERQVGGNEGRNQLLNGIISVGGYRCRENREKQMSHKYAIKSTFFLPFFFFFNAGPAEINTFMKLHFFFHLRKINQGNILHHSLLHSRGKVELHPVQVVSSSQGRTDTNSYIDICSRGQFTVTSLICKATDCTDTAPLLFIANMQCNNVDTIVVGNVVGIT